MQRWKSIDEDSDGLINRQEFISYLTARYRKNRGTGQHMSLRKLIGKKGTRAIKQIDLIDRILFGIQQIDVDEVESEER